MSHATDSVTGCLLTETVSSDIGLKFTCFQFQLAVCFYYSQGFFVDADNCYATISLSSSCWSRL